MVGAAGRCTAGNTRTNALLYADETAILCGGHNIELARSRAQAAADTLVRWARDNKMRVAGEKTRLLVLSQWARDSDCAIRVAGQVVRPVAQLKLLGAASPLTGHSTSAPTVARRGSSPDPGSVR